MGDGAVAAAPVTAVVPGVAGTQEPAVAPRGEGGKFVKPTGQPPKNAGTKSPEEAAQSKEPKPPEPVKEPYRFKRKGIINGKEQEFDLDEDGILREVQTSRALQAKAKKQSETIARAVRALELAESDPEALLREFGHDPNTLAQKRIAEQVKLETMTEHERRAYDLEQENAKLKGDAEKTKKAAEEATHKAAVQRQREANVAKYTETMKAMGEEPTYELLYLLAETERETLDPESPLYGVEFTPQQLAREAVARMDKFTQRHVGKLEGDGLNKKLGPHIDRYLGALDGPSLVKRLGPALVEKVLAAQLADWEASQTFEPKTPAPPPAPAEPGGKTEVLDEYEVARRLKGMANGVSK